MRTWIDIVEKTTNAWAMVKIDDLPVETQSDIFHAVAECPYFKKMRFDWNDAKANLANLAEPVMLWTGKANVAEISKNLVHNSSERVVAKYHTMLAKPGFEFDPILIANGKFLDGGHRLKAYARAGRHEVPVVDISPLVNASDGFWEKWFDGIDITFPQTLPIIENAGMGETDEQLRAEVIKLVGQLPWKWRDSEGREGFKNLNIAGFMDTRKVSRQWMIDVVEHYKKELAYIKANPKCVLLRQPFPPTPPRKKKTLKAMLANVGGLFEKWFYEENPGEPFDQNDLDAFENYLDDELSISVRRDGLIEFWTLERNEAAKAIGDLAVVLYHYTASGVIKEIKAHGLLAGMDSVNGTTEDGVYLTTETSGPPVRVYARGAMRAHGGYPIRIVVKAFLNELEPDPDDADIASGRHQFRVDQVPLERIIKIERAVV